jgi:hypothetical protein
MKSNTDFFLRIYRYFTPNGFSRSRKARYTLQASANNSKVIVFKQLLKRNPNMSSKKIYIICIYP